VIAARCRSREAGGIKMRFHSPQKEFSDMTAETHLTLDEEIALESLIDNSIIARYDSEIERHETYEGECYYVPLDRITLRELLTELWGNRVTSEVIEDAFTRLVEGTEEEWPSGWQDHGDDPIHNLRIDIATNEEDIAEAE
jgi:hypothetical protein